MSSSPSFLANRFDAVVMLTWSDWKTEPRSNRYHYAIRFARQLAVYFVQPDLEDPLCSVEATEVANVSLVHVYRVYSPKQRSLLNETLRKLGVRRPLFWIYNSYFRDFVIPHTAVLKIYHATEDYFVPGGDGSDQLMADLREMLPRVHLLVAVSEGVRTSFVTRGGYKGECLVLENGCDFEFWSAKARYPKAHDEITTRIALYQGGLNRRIDWQLVGELARRMPSWTFWLCGQSSKAGSELKKLQKLPNVRYMGSLSQEDVRDKAAQATVGIIPFVQEEYIRISLPLKAFEYVAADLPVVSVPIAALADFPEAFEFATDPAGFAIAIERAAQQRVSPTATAARMALARRFDYELRFRELEAKLSTLQSVNLGARTSLNLLLLYDIGSTHINAIYEHLESFQKHSRHDVHYVSATGREPCEVDFSMFDAVVVHYSVRLSLRDHLSASFADAIAGYAGLKVAFIQDEYDTTEVAREWLERLGINLVYTCVPTKFVDVVYPPARFSSVEFLPTLTGFVGDAARKGLIPIAQRVNRIVYRGRRLPFWYGELGRQKESIGRAFRSACLARGVAADIEVDDTKRIYGDTWLDFLESGRATLGTESGSNVLDEFGEIRGAIEAALRMDPDLPYEEIRARYLVQAEGRIRMNQVSPKIFEAIALRTALILIEGEYSGVVQPWKHYLPLKSDFSNLHDLILKLEDVPFLEKMTQQAFDDVIASGKFTYQSFIRSFDDDIGTRIAMNADDSRFVSVLFAANHGATWRSMLRSPQVMRCATNRPLRSSEYHWNRALIESRSGSLGSYINFAMTNIYVRVQKFWKKAPLGVRKRLSPISRIAGRIVGRSRTST